MRVSIVIIFLLACTTCASAQRTKQQKCIFEKEDAGKAPLGWTLAQTGKADGCVWKVVADDSSPSGTGFVVQQLTAAPGRIFNLCIVNNTSYRDVQLTVDLKSGKGEIDQGGGPVWRYQDANNYYVARWNPLEKNLRVYHVTDGKRKQIGTAENIELDPTKWHRLVVVHNGDQITCSLDGKEYINIKDSTIPKAGMIGLWTKADAQTYFAQLIADPLKP